jgi:hypothetical protein
VLSAPVYPAAVRRVVMTFIFFPSHSPIIEDPKSEPTRSAPWRSLDIFQTFNEVGLEVKRSTGGAQQPWLSSSPIEGVFYFKPGS